MLQAIKLIDRQRHRYTPAAHEDRAEPWGKTNTDGIEFRPNPCPETSVHKDSRLERQCSADSEACKGSRNIDLCFLSESVSVWLLSDRFGMSEGGQLWGSSRVAPSTFIPPPGPETANLGNGFLGIGSYWAGIDQSGSAVGKFRPDMMNLRAEVGWN